MPKETNEKIIENIEKVANLARLELSNEEIMRFQKQLDQIIGYIQKLNEVDVSQVQPLENPISIETILREDAVLPSIGASEILSPAPEQLYENYKVPQVVGE